MLEALGIDKRRLRLEWISGAEGKKYVKVMNEFTEEIRALGPLDLEKVALTKEGVSHE